MTDAKAAVRQAPARKSKPKPIPVSKPGSAKIGRVPPGGKGPGLSVTMRESRGGAQRQLCVVYAESKGVDHFVSSVYAADPIQLIETERQGVAGVFVKDLSKRMQIPAQRMFDMLGVPKATAEKKAAAGALLAGSGGRAALGMAKLLGMAREIVDNSTAPGAQDFDTAKWLVQWLEKPQPALGGRKPAELIDTPTGLEVVARLLGAIESGAYQ